MPSIWEVSGKTAKSWHFLENRETWQHEPITFIRHRWSGSGEQLSPVQGACACSLPSPQACFLPKAAWLAAVGPGLCSL